MYHKKIIRLIFQMVVILFSILFSSCKQEVKQDESSKSKKTESNTIPQSQSIENEEFQRVEKLLALLKKELGDEYYKPLKKATKKQLLSGKKIYQLKCAKCHGETGKGDGDYGIGLRIPPADLTDAKRASLYSDEGRKQIIRKGIVGTTMVDWDKILTEKEIDDVYFFIKQFIVDESGE